MLVSGGHERAHYALVMATGAAALGREVTLFATNAGIGLLLEGQALAEDPREALLTARGVAGIGVLWAAARELGIRCIACEAGLAAEGLRDAALSPGVERAGVATFFEAVSNGQIVTL
nr:DsrE family protein [Plastoroseomonas arctica]